MLKTDKYSDLTLKCQGAIFKVHRFVVCLQSKPLAAAVDRNWKVRYIPNSPNSPFTHL
jgi:hypothetical protein